MVSHFGVHTDSEGVVHLLQEEQSGNFIGLSGPPPFKVDDMKASCPHSIRWSLQDVPEDRHWNIFRILFLDPLVKQFTPVPKENGSQAAFFNTFPDIADLLSLLSRLCSANRSIVYSISAISNRDIVSELTITNVAPLVITGLIPEQQMRMEKIASEAMFLPRRLVLIGDPTMVAAGVLRRWQLRGLGEEDERTLKKLPWEQLGAYALRQYARGEKIGSGTPERKRLVNF